MTGKRVVICTALLILLCAGDLKAAELPCSAPAYREFDFWLGEWVVEAGEGKHAGNNHIRSSESGCLLIESWTGAQGGTGTSMNYYSGEDNQWHQLWVSPGAIIDIAGGLSDDGSMRLLGSIYYAAQDKSFPFRGSWSMQPDGSVVQFFEESRIAGEWKPWFRGIYRPIDAD